jgi:hypothetical protein
MRVSTRGTAATLRRLRAGASGATRNPHVHYAGVWTGAGCAAWGARFPGGRLIHVRLRPLSLLVAGALSCLPVNSVQWARESLPDGIACVVPIDGPDRSVEVTEESRRACVAMAHVIEPEFPVLSVDALRAGPPSVRPFLSDEEVYCRLSPRPEGQGGSPKFRCMRTDSTNRLFNQDGELVEDAHGFDGDGGLVDARGQPLLKENGKQHEGDELRIKYFVGPEPDARNREMFTETVVSHLFWALGIPVDRVYMPESVRCFGCGPNPYGQMKPDSARTPRVFQLASVERRYEGKQINVDRRRGWMGLGGGYGHGFAFAELEGLAESGSKERRTQIEVLAGALNIVAYNSPGSYQNELVCRREKWDRDTGVCTESVAYVQDVGGTLGGEKAHSLPGVPGSAMKNHPRGDWPTFSQERVFRDASRCEMFYDKPVEVLSEAGRLALDRRIRGRVGLEELLVIFEKARIHRMDSRVSAMVAAQTGRSPGPELDRRVQRLWAETINKRLQEILEARCPR